MSSSSILGIVELYISQKNELISEASDILMQITAASRKTSTLSTQTEKAKNAAATLYGDDTTEYKTACDEIQNDYELQLSQINSWEKELEVKKSNIESREQAVNVYLESYQSVLKQNVQKDYKYAQNQ